MVFPESIPSTLLAMPMVTFSAFLKILEREESLSALGRTRRALLRLIEDPEGLKASMLLLRGWSARS